MKLNLKLLAYNFFYAVLAILAIPVVLFVVFMFLFDTNSCGENSEAVAYARSLSPERLEKLYHDMEAYSVRKDLPLDGYLVYNKEAYIPEVFKDLKVAKIRPSDGNIMVEGCLDEFVYLKFKGNAWRGESQEIALTYPIHSDKPYEQKVEVLWSK